MSRKDGGHYVDANEIFDAAGVPVEGNEEAYERTHDILSELEAYLSVRHATQVISFRERIDQYQSQVDDLIQELKEHKYHLVK